MWVETTDESVNSVPERSEMREVRWYLRFDRPCQGADTIPISDALLALTPFYDSDARSLALVPLRDFLIYKGPDGGLDDRWFPAIEGLKPVQGLLRNYRRLIESGPASTYSRRERWEERLREKIAPLEVIESLLLEGQRVGAGFFIAERDG
jgi:hypothetical protein